MSAANPVTLPLAGYQSIDTLMAGLVPATHALPAAPLVRRGCPGQARA